MDSKEYQRLLKNEEMKRQEEATLAKQEARFNRAKEIREQVKQLKRFFNVYSPDGGLLRHDIISSIKIEAEVEYLDGSLDAYIPKKPIIINDVPRKLAKKFIETYIDILNREFKRL